MSVSIIDRLTQAIRIAEQSMGGTGSQADYRNWHEVHRTLQDARDALQKPDMAATTEVIDANGIQHLIGGGMTVPNGMTKLDGRSKEARALKAQQ